MKTLSIKNGLTLTLDGVPQQIIHPGPHVSHVAWQAPPHGFLLPEALVSPGQRVALGEPLFIDRHAPEIRHVSPASGTVTGITRSYQQTLSAIEIECEETPAHTFPTCARPLDSAQIRRLLQHSGLWTQLRERPFETVPASASEPAAIFVTAIDTRPLAPDPTVVIAADTQGFELGLEALATQTRGTVFVCQAPGEAVSSGLHERVQTVAFAGPHPAGLPGIHLQKLYPVSRDRRVWHVDYQDVIAIGRLLHDGVLNTDRVIALAGAQVLNPRLIRIRDGASVAEITQDQLFLEPVPDKPILGSLLAGRHGQWLGRFDRQITVMARQPNRLVGGHAAAQAIQTIQTIQTVQTTQTHNVADNPVIGKKLASMGFVAEPRFERVNALDILPVPLLRALLTGEHEKAEALGCLELSAEDLETLSFICPAGNDYAAALANCHLQLRGLSA